MSLLYHAYVYLEFLILACTIYILAPEISRRRFDHTPNFTVNDVEVEFKDIGGNKAK
jgi:hypothetical protein